MQTVAKTDVGYWASKRIKLAQKHFKHSFRMPNVSNTKATLYLKTGWIPLYRLGATQGVRGARVKGRKMVRGSFLAKMQSGHEGVFKRSKTRKMEEKNKAAIYELFGPNPANDIITSRKFYEDILSKVIADELGHRMLSELSYAIGGSSKMDESTKQHLKSLRNIRRGK